MNTPSTREVPTPVKLAGFGTALAAVFLATLLLGGQVGPLGEPAAADHDSSGGSDHSAIGVSDADAAGDGHGGHSNADSQDAAAVEVPGGLQVSEAGFTLVPARTVLPAGNQEIAFEIQGPDGDPVTDYQVEHEKELHLIAVRRDFTGFQHVHPELGADGTWSTTVDLTGGTWRLFADFTPAPPEGDAPVPLTLGADLTVTGPTGRPSAQAARSERVDIVDGYRVGLTGDFTAGKESDVAFEVTRDGRAIKDLQPYLGARGHLVALREGDLAYLHVHPTDGEDAIGNTVGFAATAPSVGSYRLYLDFRLDGVVRTAEFVLSASTPATADVQGGSDDPAGESGDQDDHTH
ncbi:hypothetical protein [Nocardioides coralli]|uniref:hypothetical protein n=1 Tax=Nocardioides coralli TaxID=2872154 RepID=UPI001CA4587C|nr:hypothetical protein [Nocardioides coralli]QZY27737.1 hypothetical protein K6T13_09415 [Nocardioides coralli]